MSSWTKHLLRMEEYARKYFERMPFAQAFLAGVGVIIFWRGIWEWLDDIEVSPFASVLIGTLILACVGVFVQTFIGNTIIIDEVKQEEKAEKRALKKIEGEEGAEAVTLAALSNKIDLLIKKIEEKK